MASIQRTFTAGRQPHASGALPRRPQATRSSAISGSAFLGIPGKVSRRNGLENVAQPRRRLPVARAAVKSMIPTHGYDFYQLLGVDPGASYEEIKASYRRLQKKCHPDVAGREDMAILLNEAYAALSDPIMRFTYDQLRVTWLQDDSFTGQPKFSTWHGPEEEEAAIFVDELSCIGCLNCAVIANKTFAVELKHGRARAVRQWADDQETLNAAMLSCPVSCIKWVERSKLAALEHVLSTIRRPSLHAHGDGGSAPDVFTATDKFLQKRSKNEKEHLEAQERRSRSEGAFSAIKSWWVPRQRPGEEGDGYSGPRSLVPLMSYDVTEEAKEARRQRVGSKDGLVPEELRALHNATKRGTRNGMDGIFFTVKVGDSEEEYWNPTVPSEEKAPGKTPEEPATAAATSGLANEARDPSDATNGGSGRRPSVADADSVAWVYRESAGQFIHPELWPKDDLAVAKGFKETLAPYSVLPLLFAMGAGFWAWLEPSADTYGQAASSLAHGVPAVHTMLPAEVVVSGGLRMALCMAVWYTVGAIIANSARLASAYLVRAGKEHSDNEQ